MEKWALLGVSRGLGKAFVQKVDEACLADSLLLMSRDSESLKDMSLSCGISSSYKACDFSKRAPLQELDEFKPNRIFYFAGGGPYGDFFKKEFKDHMWAFHVNFLTPSEIVHHFLNKKVKQIIIIGSFVAESDEDENCVSYSVSKKSIFNLCSGLNKEHPELDLRIYSPSYMDTGMLTKNSFPREQGFHLLNPCDVVDDLLKWILMKKTHFHRSYKI